MEPDEEAAMGWLWAIIVGFVLGLIALAIKNAREMALLPYAGAGR